MWRVRQRAPPRLAFLDERKNRADGSPRQAPGSWQDFRVIRGSPPNSWYDAPPHLVPILQTAKKRRREVAAYALAKAMNAPLLYKGDDFIHTEISYRAQKRASAALDRHYPTKLSTTLTDV